MSWVAINMLEGRSCFIGLVDQLSLLVMWKIERGGGGVYVATFNSKCWGAWVTPGGWRGDSGSCSEPSSLLTSHQDPTHTDRPDAASQICTCDFNQHMFWVPLQKGTCGLTLNCRPFCLCLIPRHVRLHFEFKTTPSAFLQSPIRQSKQVQNHLRPRANVFLYIYAETWKQNGQLTGSFFDLTQYTEEGGLHSVAV